MHHSISASIFTSILLCVSVHSLHFLKRYQWYDVGSTLIHSYLFSATSICNDPVFKHYEIIARHDYLRHIINALHQTYLYHLSSVKIGRRSTLWTVFGTSHRCVPVCIYWLHEIMDACNQLWLWLLPCYSSTYQGIADQSILSQTTLSCPLGEACTPKFSPSSVAGFSKK
jgi:hypothetical protein